MGKRNWKEVFIAIFGCLLYRLTLMCVFGDLGELCEVRDRTSIVTFSTTLLISY